MNRTEFVVVTAVVLFLAFALGWFLSWLVHRVARVTDNSMTELDKMAQALHEAEETRDLAITHLETREQEMANQQAQTEAELQAAMDGLREARGHIEKLQDASTTD